MNEPTREEIERFVQLVSDMRAWQKCYFRTRDTNDLKQAKQREKAVDECLARLLQDPFNLFTETEQRGV